jgi:hypothetical protein
MNSMVDDPVQRLREEFRRHLEAFYGQLNLAAPYHSIEKALEHLMVIVKALPAPERERLLADPSLRWEAYAHAFSESGLNRKHRGIIKRLDQASLPPSFPAEYRKLLDTYFV